MKRNQLFLCFIVLLSACSPKITTTLVKKEKPISKNATVTVFEKDETLPANTEKLGIVRVNENTSKAEFDYNSVVDIAKIEAGKAGGNAIRIIKHQMPDFFNTGHEVYADIIKVDTGIVGKRSNQRSKESNIKIPYSHWRLALNGGYAYSLGKDISIYDARLQTYNNQMKSGLNLGAEVNWFFANGQMGIGMNYESVSSQNSLNGVTHLSNGAVFTNNNLSDNLNIQYIGPMYTGISRRIKNNRIKDALIINVGMGSFSYLDTKKVDFRNYRITGSALGTYYSIGYDRFISKSMALGIQLSLTAGLLGSYDAFDGNTTYHTQLDNNNFQSLSHINLTVGLRFNTPK